MGARSRILVVSAPSTAFPPAEYAVRLTSAADVAAFDAVLPVTALPAAPAVPAAAPTPASTGAPAGSGAPAPAAPTDDVVFTRVAAQPVVAALPGVSPPFNLSCSYFGIAVAATGEVIASRGLDEPAHIASITKVPRRRWGNAQPYRARSRVTRSRARV